MDKLGSRTDDDGVNAATAVKAHGRWWRERRRLTNSSRVNNGFAISCFFLYSQGAAKEQSTEKNEQNYNLLLLFVEFA
jgi:hypothetical protein